MRQSRPELNQWGMSKNGFCQNRWGGARRKRKFAEKGGKRGNQRGTNNLQKMVGKFGELIHCDLGGGLESSFLCKLQDRENCGKGRYEFKNAFKTVGE